MILFWGTIDLFMCFGTLFQDFILWWCYNILEWKFSKQTSHWFKKVFFSQLEIIINFHPKISWYHPKITSKNIVPKDMNKSQTHPKDKFCFHESIFQWKIKLFFLIEESCDTSERKQLSYFQNGNFFKIILWCLGKMQVKK